MLTLCLKFWEVLKYIVYQLISHLCLTFPKDVAYHFVSNEISHVMVHYSRTEETGIK